MTSVYLKILQIIRNKKIQTSKETGRFYPPSSCCLSELLSSKM